MKRYLLYSLIAVFACLAGLLAYLAYPHRSLQNLDHEPPIPLISGVKRCKPHTVYYSEKNEYSQSGEGVVDASCAKWQYDLEKAVEKHDLELARTALAHGANPNSPGDNYFLNHSMPLAAQTGNTEMVRLLLDNGADINFAQCCCMSCYTALTAAVEIGNLPLVELLIARGANVDYHIRYAEGETVLTLAKQKGNKEIVKLIDEASSRSWRHRAETRLVEVFHGDLVNHRYYFQR